MTMTLPTVESTSDEIKDLDFEISCVMPDCENHADWWCVCLSCRDHSPVCEPCRRREVLRMESMSARAVMTCTECLSRTYCRYWRDLFSFDPIVRA